MESNYDYNNKKTLARLHKLSGQIVGITRMVEEQRDCEDVTVQLSAVISGLDKVRRIILAENIRNAVHITDDDLNDEQLSNLYSSLQQLIKTK